MLSAQQTKADLKLETDSDRHPSETFLETTPDAEQGQMDLNPERFNCVFEEGDQPCGFHFMAVGLRAEDRTWDSATAAQKETGRASDGETCSVHLLEASGPGKVTGNRHVGPERRRPSNRVHKAKETQAEKRERDRLRKRRYRASMPQEALAKQRERNRLSMSKFRASLSAEELKRRREKDMLLKREARDGKRRQRKDITS